MILMKLTMFWILKNIKRGLPSFSLYLPCVLHNRCLCEFQPIFPLDLWQYLPPLMLVYPVAVRDDTSNLPKFSLSFTNPAISNGILLCLINIHLVTLFFTNQEISNGILIFFINIILVTISAQVPITILLSPKVGELHASALNTSTH